MRGYRAEQSVPASPECCVSVKTIEDVVIARRSLHELAQTLGFDEPACAEIELAVTELATNLAVHHTRKGKLIGRVINDEFDRGLEIEARDRGPGIADPASALQDHHSTGGSLGCGLGAVRRLMDEFEISSHSTTAWPVETAGTHVKVRKWLGSGRPGRFAYSTQSRPLMGETKNGDQYFVTEERNGFFVAMADGLGHGAAAEQASAMAIDWIRDHHWEKFDTLLKKLHQELHGTRGVALTLCRILLPERELIHTGIGNVQARFYPRTGINILPKPGVLGVGAPPDPGSTACRGPQMVFWWSFPTGSRNAGITRTLPRVQGYPSSTSVTASCKNMPGLTTMPPWLW